MKKCVLNAYVGESWYHKGQARLLASLQLHAPDVDHLMYSAGWPLPGYDSTCHYNIKACALEDAIARGYRQILWADCSAWAVQPLDPIWNLSDERGHYFWTSGYNCAQTCSDLCLEYFGVDRDTAETYADVGTGLIVLNLDNPVTFEFARRWIRAAKDGVFHGSRLHADQSQDPRFLFHRQDQSAASILANLLGMEIDMPGIYVTIQTDNAGKDVVFKLRGM